ncbi:MAG: hypothetical protein XU10_C0020G0029 [Chloroflexi bacterium CSP1-4]|nr:MAG: hypothetical protein XU10_C0020G0029 [Chloroflexi bacterium CSP1-4]
MRPTRPRRPRPTSRRRSRGARGERGARSPAGIVSRKRTGTRRPSVVTTTATSSRLSFDRSTLLLPVGRFAESRRRSCRCPPMPMVPVERRTPSGPLSAPSGPRRAASGPVGLLRRRIHLSGAWFRARPASAPAADPLRAASRPPGGPFGVGSISRGHGFAPSMASALPKGARKAPSSTPGAAAMPGSNGVARNSPVTAGEPRSGLMCAWPPGEQPPHGDRPPRAVPPPPCASSATCAALSGWRSAGHVRTPG